MAKKVGGRSPIAVRKAHQGFAVRWFKLKMYGGIHPLRIGNLAFPGNACIGPQLGAILSLAASEASVARGTVLLGIYALGLGIPFLLAAMFITRAMGVMNRIKRHMKLIERIMGVLLIAVGVALMTGAFSAFAFWLLETFPALGQLG